MVESLETLRTHFHGLPEERKYWEQRDLIALLVGDWEAAGVEARHRLEHFGDGWVPGWREYLSSALALIAGDEATARAHHA